MLEEPGCNRGRTAQPELTDSPRIPQDSVCFRGSRESVKVHVTFSGFMTALPLAHFLKSKMNQISSLVGEKCPKELNCVQVWGCSRVRALLLG